jgi:hypothetical protein
MALRPSVDTNGAGTESFPLPGYVRSCGSPPVRAHDQGFGNRPSLRQGPRAAFGWQVSLLGRLGGGVEPTCQSPYPMTERRSRMIELVSLPFSGMSTAAAR